MSGPEFFALAYRVSAYQGVMAARLEAQREDPDPEKPREVDITSSEVNDLFD